MNTESEIMDMIATEALEQVAPFTPPDPNVFTIDFTDPEIVWIFTRMIYMTCPIAHVLHGAGILMPDGKPIPTHAEEEHFTVLWWMLGLYRDYGPAWKKEGDARLKAMVAARGTCRVCGCTEADCRQCIEKTGRPCTWANPTRTLCSACAMEAAGASFKHPNPA